MKHSPDDPTNSNETSSQIRHSGNSDVVVTINFDTRPLAYAIACYLHATGRLDDSQFNRMVKGLRNLNGSEGDAPGAP
jgi:hypothetical protein